MCLVRMQIKPTRRISRAKLEDLAGAYVSLLHKNGQIISEDWLSAWREDVLDFYFDVPVADALEHNHDSEWGREALGKLEAYAGCCCVWAVIEDHAPRRFPSLKSSSFLYLEPSVPSPVHRGRDGRAVPLYLLPVDQRVRQAIFFWNNLGQHLFYIWLDSGTLEIPAYRQLSDPCSDYCVRGRDLCQVIEKATEVPTFLYLERYWGRKEGEEDRLCPVCGNPWRNEHKDNVKVGYPPLDFKCEPCRLVSQVASVDEDERHARIGEYKNNWTKKKHLV